VVSEEAADSYGGQAAAVKPMVYELALLHDTDRLETTTEYLDLRVHQPRALAYDANEDRLYLAGYGDDELTAIERASTSSPTIAWTTKLELPAKEACGIDGLALEPESGGGLWVHCEFARKTARLELASRTSHVNEKWLVGETLAESTRSPEVELGAELFRRSDSRISSGGDFACSSCHPEGRSDGLTWRLGKSILQAPVLAGRVAGTGPYKWDGQDATLHDSLRHTMQRIGGGWPSTLDDREVAAMVAYLESLPGPKPPRIGDPKAIERGREVFEQASCDACHEGDRFTDRNQHALDTTLARVDTPSLIGLAHSRPVARGLPRWAANHGKRRAARRACARARARARGCARAPERHVGGARAGCGSSCRRHRGGARSPRRGCADPRRRRWRAFVAAAGRRRSR
jgi:mono/diheme cytochrome c family protein